MRVVARVDHHAHIYVVEHAEANELLLAAVDQLAALAHLGAASDLDKLLRGQPEEGDGASELLHQPGLGESRGHRVDGGNLEIVSAGVRRAGILHCKRMLAADYAVKLSDDGDLRPLRAARHIGAEPRARKAARNLRPAPRAPPKLVRGARLKNQKSSACRDIVRESLRLIITESTASQSGFLSSFLSMFITPRRMLLHNTVRLYNNVMQYGFSCGAKLKKRIKIRLGAKFTRFAAHERAARISAYENQTKR